MKYEIIRLLEREGKTPESSDINDVANLIEEIGKNQTEHIKASEISKDMNTKFVGRNLYVYPEVGSTNAVAKFLSENGIENGSVVIAEKQTAGRGRTGKSWESPLGGVWLSIILAPDVDDSKIPLITLATGVAVAKTLEKIGIDNPEIKWPNDLMLNDKKVCGILTEAVTNFNKIRNVIVGVGIDANFSTDELPEELKGITTTLKEELGKEVDKNLLIKIFLEEFEEICELFNHDCHETILTEWRKRSYTIGKTVEVKKPSNKTYDAYAIGISKEGSLVVEKSDGSLEKVISGECTIKK